MIEFTALQLLGVTALIIGLVSLAAAIWWALPNDPMGRRGE